MNDETEFEIIDGCNGSVLNVEAELRVAPDGETIHRLLSCGNSAKPSGATRRRWLQAAALRYQQLRNDRAEGVGEILPVSSENAEKTEETFHKCLYCDKQIPVDDETCSFCTSDLEQGNNREANTEV